MLNFIGVLLCLAVSSRATWTNEQVSTQRIGPIVGGKTDGDRERLFAAAAGNIYDGRIFELSLAKTGWQEKQIHSAKGEVDVLTVGHDCKGARSFYLEARGSGGTERLRPDASGLHPISETSESPASEERILTLIDGSTISVMMGANEAARRLACDREFARAPAAPVAQGRARPDQYIALTSGDLRGDGVRRYYGMSQRFGFQSGHWVLFELTPRKGRWELDLLSERSSFAHTNMLIEDVRGDGRPALYATFGNAVIEIRRNGSAWQTLTVGSTGITAGMAIGAFRGDRRKRIYVGDGHYISEFSYAKSGWRLDRISPRRGVLSWLASGQATGQERPGIFFSIMNRQGLYQLKWEEGARVIVADFVRDATVASEVDSFAELLRFKIIQIGNCTVLEREQMKHILAELNAIRAP